MPLGRTPTKDESRDFYGFDEAGNGIGQLPTPASLSPSTGSNVAVDARVLQQLTSLSRQRSQVFQKVVRVHNTIKSADMDLPQLEVFVEKLKAAYAEFSGFHSQIVAIIPDEEFARQEEHYEKFERLHDWTCAKIKAQIKEHERPPLQQQPPPPQVIIHQQPLKAPIPTFDGEYTNWPKFKAMFQDVMAQSRDSDAIKLYHLDKALVGSAAGVLDAKTIHEGNYAQAWNILTERYENQRIIVETHIRGLLSLKRMTNESNKELRTLVDECNKHVESLKYLNQEVSGVSELMIVYLLTSALDKSTRKLWEQSLNSGELPKYQATLNFLKDQCQVLERCEAANPTPIPKSTLVSKQPMVQPKPASQRTHAVTASFNKSAEECSFCNGPHRNYQCNKLSAMSHTDKIEKVRSTGACFNCLMKGHRSRDCPSTKNCQKCDERHHTQLHEDDQKPKMNIASPALKEDGVKDVQSSTMVLNPIQPTVSSMSCNHAASPKTVLLLTALVQVLDKNNQPHECRVLLDSGSQVNFITERLADILDLEKIRVNIPIGGINDIKTSARDKIEVPLQSRCSNFRTELECLIIPKITGVIPSIQIDICNWNIPYGIQLADPAFYKPDRIDLLIGAALFFKLLKPSQLTIDEGMPELRDSQLGWLVAGTVETNPRYEPIQYAQVASIQSVDNSIARFWQLEEVPTTPMTTTDEQQCEQHFVSTFSRDSTGRFVVRLPLKDNVNQLDSCRNLALKRFFMLENRLLRNPVLRTMYVEFIREYQRLGHCREVGEFVESEAHGVYYLPHHAVLRSSSSTTKCRVVFDASAKASPSSLSLNNVLYVGPVVQPDLFSIVLRFRKHRYVFTTDIAKMYRQVRIHPEDTAYQRIFWRESPNEPLRVLELTTVTYGTASAPYQATRCLIQLAHDEAKEFPVAAEILKHDCYVDDVLSGSDTLENAIDAQIQLKAMLEKGGFPVHKWCSNSPQVLELIPENERETLQPHDEHDINNVIKVLGLHWEPHSDQLCIAAPALTSRSPATKRNIYSDIAKLFDPLGLVSPTVVIAKLLVQELWRSRLDWDEPVPDDILIKWNDLRNSLADISKLSIPRQVTCVGAVNYELHGFADASMVAFGASVYVRSIFVNGTACSRLLSSKSKVAPLHELTIPRKELCAALLLVRLVSKVISVMDLPFRQIVLWSDSQIVLAWLKKHPDQLEPFVCHRIAEIKRHTTVDQWHYIRSQHNPADIVSRGQLPASLSQNSLWWEGPKFLSAPIIETEQSLGIPDEELPELKATWAATLALIKEQLDVFTRFSCFRKLQRVVGWILRFNKNSRKPKCERTMQEHLTISELRQALLVIIRVTQHINFGTEIQRIERGQPCNQLGALTPILVDGVLRVGGRLKHSNLLDETKHQLILPNTSPVTKSLIQTLHKEHLHMGPGGLISALRQRFWLLNARSTVRQVIRNCVQCFRSNPTDVHQLMGELPKQRVVPSDQFSITGVDYAGPIQVKQGRYRPKIEKAYISVFVCMATKAVHLELVSSLTTESFIAALQRFVSRRGMVVEIHSDNATNFHGAHNKLRELYELFQKQQEVNKIIEFCQMKEISWNFIPPDAPEFGGLWEAAVKSTKTHLKRVIGNTTLTFEEMSTLLCEIEAVLNSRPLFAISTDPNDPEVITPGHFIIGRPMTAIPEPSRSEERINRLTRWHHIQLMREHFWKAWSRDYLASLQPRKKNRQKLDNVRPGMVVLLQDKNRPPLEWKLGRVTAVFPGPDNLVRTVDVFSEGATYRRPITRISILPIEDNEVASSFPGGVCSVAQRTEDDAIWHDEIIIPRARTTYTQSTVQTCSNVFLPHQRTTKLPIQWEQQ